LPANSQKKGYQVVLFSKHAKTLEKTIIVSDEDLGQKYEVSPYLITDQMKDVFNRTDFVFITYPSFLFPTLATEIFKCDLNKIPLVFVPGTGGVEFSFRALRERGTPIYGLERVPAVYRITKGTNIANISGRRKEGLHLGLLSSDNPDLMCEQLSFLFGMPCYRTPNYLNITLTPSNPILHTCRLYSLFSDYSGKPYKQVPLFYSDWSFFASEQLLHCDDELKNIIHSIPELDLSGVESLRDHYESKNAEELTAKIRSIKSLSGLPSPIVQTEGGYLPDFSSRYFAADFPYGLAILVGIAQIVGAEAKTMIKVLSWYEKIIGYQWLNNGLLTGADIDKCGCPQRFGIKDKSVFIDIYR
jgi:hypothetical protein